MLLEGEPPPIQRSPSSPTNLFLSHSWNVDLRGRPTHDRVKALRQELGRLGWKLWFDEERLLLGCNVDSKMASGIRNADAICLCITRSYIEKINAQNNNCAKEWNFAQAMGKKMLPIILEEEMLDVKAWPPGIVTMYLGNTFYIDCTSDDTRENAQKLSKMLELLGLSPRLRSSYSWPLRKSISIPSLLRTNSSRSVRRQIRI